MYLFRLQICGLLIKIMYIWKLALTFSAMWAPGHQITAVLICSHIALLLVIIHIHTYIIVSFCASNLSLLRWRHFSAFLEFLFFFHARTHTLTLNMLFLIYPLDLFITPHFSPLSPFPFPLINATSSWYLMQVPHCTMIECFILLIIVLDIYDPLCVHFIRFTALHHFLWQADFERDVRGQLHLQFSFRLTQPCFPFLFFFNSGSRMI